VRRAAHVTALTIMLASAWSGDASAVPAEPAATQALPVRLDGVLAVVGANAPTAGADVVLRSDVELRARLLLAAETVGGELPIGPLPEALLSASLQEIIGELLIAREARRVQIALPTPADAQREKDRLVRSACSSQRFCASTSKALPPSRKPSSSKRCHRARMVRASNSCALTWPRLRSSVR